MKTLFENQYTCTQEIYEDIYRHFYFRHPLYLGIGITLILFTVLTNAISILGMGTLNLPSIAFLLVYYVLLSIVCKSSAKKRYQADLKINMNRPLTATFSFRDDAIALKFTNSSVTTTPYADIKKVTQTKELLMLVTKDKVSLTLKKDSFKSGTLEAFKKFLETKNIIVK